MRVAVVAVRLGLLTQLLACGQRPLCPDTFVDAEIPVPATAVGSPLMISPVNAATTSAPQGVAVTIASSQGTVEFDGRGPLQAFIYERESFAAAGSTLYAGLAISDSAWVPFWLYCSSDGRLTAVAGEMTDRDVGLLYDVQGTCSDQYVAPMAPLVVPTHTLRTVALTCGFSITAPEPNQLDIAGGRVGSMVIGGDSALVYPFHTVDCRTGCGSPGWYEVHAVVWNQSRATASFGIFYLTQSSVTISNGITLPSGNAFQADEFPNATWTISPP